MKFFLDTANLNEIIEANDLGVISGITTNPSLISKEGNDFVQTIKKIDNIVDGPISAEVNSYDYDSMIREGEELSKISKNIVVKLPMTYDGLKACKYLTSKGIKTNVTLIFSLNQALLAAEANATYVSPFIGRIDDIGYDGLELIDQIVSAFSNYDYNTKIIAASVRNINHVNKCAEMGCDIATIPFKVLKSMISHPLTEKGIEIFKRDWESFNKK